MEIIDAQIHAPEPVVALEDRYDEDVRMLLACELAREAMDSVGVDIAVLHAARPVVEFCISRYPERFAGCISYPDRAAGQQGVTDAQLGEIAACRERPGMLAIRVGLVHWPTKRPHEDLLAGALEPVFTTAEQHRVPVFCLASGIVDHVRPIVEAHPDLTLILDHFGLSVYPPMRLVDPDPWPALPAVLALAEYPNVALKFSGGLSLSSEPYPHRDLWPRFHKIIEAFGPGRLLWGSDYTRLRCGPGTNVRGSRDQWGGLYSDAVNYVRDTVELTQEEKRLMFAGALRRVLRWPRRDSADAN
jgi:predicted TIM-barrel fold metal-dependent hydrolase